LYDDFVGVKAGKSKQLGQDFVEDEINEGASQGGVGEEGQ